MAVAASFMDGGTDSRAWHVVIASAGRIRQRKATGSQDTSEVFAEGKASGAETKIRVKPKAP